jgi:hypothetical protein
MGKHGQCHSSQVTKQGKHRRGKLSFKLQDNWALRVCVQKEGRLGKLALVHLGIDSMLRGCDLVTLKVCDVRHGEQLSKHAVVEQQKSQPCSLKAQRRPEHSTSDISNHDPIIVPHDSWENPSALTEPGYTAVTLS